MVLALAVGSCTQSTLVIPEGFPKPVIPSNDPVTASKVELGRYLFYTTDLSRNNKLSCASCHLPSASFADPGKPWSFGVDNRHGARNAPAIVNPAYDASCFWDGRAASLEDQAVGPIYNPVELDNDSVTVMRALRTDAIFPAMFSRAYGDTQITMTRIAYAIASFERTMMSDSSPYDRYTRGDLSALSAAAKRGFTLFKSPEVNCISCHSGPNFTDNQYHSNGLDFHYPDAGRFNVTHDPNDIGKFRTPTLRNLVFTAPYMHDGRYNNLLQVVNHYNQGGQHNPTQDPRVHPLHLTRPQMEDIVAFLKSLSDSTFITRKDLSNPYK